MQVLDLFSDKAYHSNETFLIPFATSDIQNIKLESKDTNQDKRFSQNLCLMFGRYDELRWKNSTEWFFRTGANLFSAYFLILISLFLGFSFWLRRSGLGLALLAYSVVSAIYLFSFSEYPRSLIDPVLASGGIHFPLRLLQDLALIFVLYNFHQRYDPQNIIKKIAWVYAGVIAIYLLMLLIEVKDYIYHSRIIIIMAPLVAAPMAIGTWFAFKLKDPIERKVLIPVSIILFAFQLNDLFVFWKLSNSYFTIRLYIPFIVGMALFLYFRRMYEEFTKLNIIKERQKIFKEFLHDVKSPLAVLRIFFASRNEIEEHTQVINSALDRIENMVKQVDYPSNNEPQTKFKIISALNEVLKQKKIEFSDLKISFETNNDAYVFASKAKLQRIFSNIINNSYEAYPSNRNKTIEVKVLFGADEVRIFFTDQGGGIPKSIFGKLFKEEITNKSTGQGIGLSSAYRYIKDIGGNLEVISKEGTGTTIAITLLSAMSEVIFSEIENYSSERMESPDLILIDDDKYIRLSWKHYAQSTGKTIKTYDSLDSFFAEADKINRDTAIYLDINIGAEKSTNHLAHFDKLGFKNITLATGEDIEPEHLPIGVIGVSGKLPPLQ